MNRPWPRPFVLAVLCSAVVGASRAGLAEEEPGVVVAAPVLHFSDGPVPAFGLPATQETEKSLGCVFAFPEREWLGGTVQRLLEEEVKAAGGEFLDSDPHHLRVTGSSAAVDLVRKRCADLQRMLDGAVVLDVSLLRLPAGADPDPTGERLTALVRSGGAQVLFGQRLSVLRGETHVSEATDARSFVARHDGEVAQYASVQVPVTRRLLAGRRLAAQARTLPSGRATVTVSLQVVTPAERMRQATVAGVALDLPEATFTSLCAPFVLAKGETGTAVVPDAAGDGHLLLRVTVAEAEAPRAGDRALVDLQAFVGDRGPVARSVAPGPVQTSTDDDVDAARDARFEAVKDRFYSAKLAGDEIGAGLRLTDAALAEQVEREFADHLRTSRVVRRSLRLPFAELSQAAWWDPLTGRPSGAPPSPQGPVLRLPVRGDTPAVWMSGTWRRALAGVETEIADGAVAVLADVAEHFAGETVVAEWTTAAPSLTVDHRTAALLDPAPMPGRARIELNGTPRTEETPLDGMTTAISRSRVDLGAAKDGGPETTLRREGADAVVSWWTAE